MNLVREKRINEEDEERKRLDLTYKEKIIKAEQEKIAQLEAVTKLDEEEEERSKESQEQEKIIQSEEEKDEEKEKDKKEEEKKED